MLSEAYVSAMARGEVEGIVVVDERDGWQVQFVGYTPRRGVAFKVVDTRSVDARLRDELAPSCRVWNVRYNPINRTCGGRFFVLHDFYPAVAKWAAGVINAYAIANNVTGGQRGNFSKVNAKTAEDA